jgi:predicted permease
MQGIVFRPLPGVEQASRLRLVEPRTESGSYPGASWPEYRDLKERLTTFRSLAAFRMLPLNFGEPGREARVYSQLVSGNYFAVLGLRPALGRLLRPDEVTRSGGDAVAVISHQFWQRQFGGDANVLGRTIRLNERPVTIVGVAPEGFLGTAIGLSFDVWLPATLAPVLLGGADEIETRETRTYSLFGELDKGVTMAAAQAQLDGAMRGLAGLYPATNASMQAEVLAFWRAPRGAPRFLFGGLAALQGFMLLVLVVVCANAANLLLARTTARRREIGVRLALGGRPGQILRQFLTESVLLGLLAAGLGVLVALWGNSALRAVPLPGGFPFKFETELGLGGVAFAAGLSLACALIFGLAPALQAARTDSQLALRAARQGEGRGRMRSALIASEAALALLVLVVAAMFLRNFLETRVADPGFKPAGVLLASYDLSSGGYDQAKGLPLMDELLRRLAAAPGIDSAAIASWVPLDFHAMPQAAFKLDGRADAPQSRCLTYTVTPGYFHVMEIPFVAGRDFAALAEKGSGPQVVVNEEFVRQYLGGAPALGHRLGGRSSYEIVGVVRNALYENFGEPAKPIVYFSYRDLFWLTGQIHVRTSGAENGLAGALRGIVSGINPAVALYDVRTMTEHVEKNLFFRRIPARLFAVLGPLILLLTGIGIYAGVAYSVAQRTTEIGVRLALGASGPQVVAQIVRETLRLAGFGLAPAWLLAVIVMLHVRGGALNAPILLGVPLLLLAVAWLAAWLPARRAAKVDPMVALRAE